MTTYSAEEAFERYGDMILRLETARTRGRSEGEDALQEMFVRYIKSDTQFASEEHRMTLYYAVVSLPPKYRIAVHLFYYEELSTKEIAELMGCAEGTVRSLLGRSRNKLGKIRKGVEFDVSR